MRVRSYIPKLLLASAVLCLSVFVASPGKTSAAINLLPPPPPGSGSYGLEATKKQPPPTVPATITIPGNGASFSDSPVTVSGLCLDGLLVEVYNNDVLSGSEQCKNGSFSLKITLFNGQNDITASVFDDLDQTGPASNIVSVTYSNVHLTSFGTLVTLTSNYGRRAANPDTPLTWPLILSGGSGPYAFSIDWGDGEAPELKSQPVAGQITIVHTYKKSGLYRVVVKVTDVNGVTAFIQLTAIANGKVNAADVTTTNNKTITIVKVLWIPVVVAFALLFPTYWLGRRSQLVSLHRKLERSLENYKDI
jgi:hypothetical protein